MSRGRLEERLEILRQLRVSTPDDAAVSLLGSSLGDRSNLIVAEAARMVAELGLQLQMEPVWGGQEDAAAELRGTSILGLIACTDLSRHMILKRLVDALSDAAHPVRTDAARALEQMCGEKNRDRHLCPYFFATDYTDLADRRAAKSRRTALPKTKQLIR